MSDPSRYADWKAPDEDGQTLIWPARDQVIEQARANHRSLSSSEVRIGGERLGELRARMRRWLGHKEDGQLIFASGHQAELFHPGVWVKDVLADALTKHTEGRAMHLAVDTDAPKHLHLRWPGASLPIGDDDRLASVAWSGLLDGPTPAHVNEVEEAYRAASAGWGFATMTPEFLDALRKSAMEQQPLAPALTNAIHALDWRLGLRHEALMASPLWGSSVFMEFARHVLADAVNFAGHYNTALAAYRREARISSPGRPMPDLVVDDARIETPFWLDDLTKQTRQRLYLQRNGLLGDIEVAAISADQLLAHCRSRGWRISPRALTLTLFVRMFLADQFIHGIGGGRYDQVTDRLVQSYFGIDPPRFAVTTATMYFPAASGQKRISLRPLLQEGRRIRHGGFWGEKRALAQKIAELPRGSRERRDIFFGMHRKLAAMGESPAMREWSRRLEEATREQLRQKAVFDRELFFALQPEARLAEMIARYQG